MDFQCINIRQVPREVLKTAASGLGFQNLPGDLANVNAWKTMFDPYSEDTQKMPNRKAQPIQGTKRWREEEQIRTKQTV